MSLQPTSYDLEERTYQFALNIRKLVAGHKWQRQHFTDIDQVLRSSGSVGANYIEANDAVSDKDFIFRIKISKKEAKESRYWIRLLGATSIEAAKEELRNLYQEADELMRILATILKNRQSKQ